MDDILIEDLAASPPQTWARQIEQAAALRSFMARTEINHGEVKATYSKMGISRRHFYLLLAQQRARIAGAPPRGSRQGLQFSIDRRKEDVIAAAIAEAGPSARGKDVYAYAVELAIAREIEPPSRTSVRTRFGKRRRDVDVVGRLQTNCDFIIDVCPVGLSLSDDAGNPCTGWFLALIDTKNACLIAHELYAGQPRASQVRSFLSSSLRWSESDLRRASVGITAPLPNLSIPPSISNHGRSLVSVELKKISGGTAVRALYGMAIGRIPIRSKASDLADDGSPIPLPIAAAVVRKIVSASV